MPAKATIAESRNFATAQKPQGERTADGFEPIGDIAARLVAQAQAAREKREAGE